MPTPTFVAYPGSETDDERMTAAATAVLQRRLDGATHRAAVEAVCASHALTRTAVGRAWASKRRAALAELTRGRVMDACPWTDDEVQRIMDIFAGKLWPDAEDGPENGSGSA